MLLAVVRLPKSPEAFSRAAPLTGLAPADLQRRTAGILPRVLLVEADGSRLATICAQLESLGFITVLVDPLAVPGDDQRIVARTLSFGAGELSVIRGVGAQTRHDIPLSAIDLLQRGTRTQSEVSTTKTTETKFALGRAVVSGGLVMTKKVDKTSTQKVESREPFVVIHRNDGGPDVILYEKRLDFRFLGSEMQPSSFGNLQLTLTKLRTLAPAAAFDDRVGRPGFVAGLPSTRAEPVDLALHLVRVSRPLE